MGISAKPVNCAKRNSIFLAKVLRGLYYVAWNISAIMMGVLAV